MRKKPQPAARKRRRNSRDQIDASAVLNKWVTITKNGREQRMTSFEVTLRAQVKKALKDKSLPAILNALATASRHELLKPAPEAQRVGGVLVVTGRLTKESWAALFKKPDDDSKSDSSNSK